MAGPFYLNFSTGVDSAGTSGLSANPWKTVTYANTRMNAGETVYFRGGDHTYTASVSNWKGGVDINNRTRYLAYPGESPRVRLNGAIGNNAFFLLYNVSGLQFIEISGLELDGIDKSDGHGIKCEGSASITNGSHLLSDLVIHHFKNNGILTHYSSSNHIRAIHAHNNGTTNQEHGIYHGTGSSNGLIEDCILHNNSGSGLQQWSSTNNVNNNVYRNIDIYDNGTTGFFLWAGVGNVAYGIRAYGNAHAGVWMQHGSGNALYRTAIYGNLSGGGTAGLYLGGSSPGHIIRNVISLGNTTSNYTDATTGSTTVTSNNVLTGSHGTYFVDAPNGNFHPVSTSPAINAGVAVGVSFDPDGTIIPQGSAPDIGPYEFIEALWTAANQNPGGVWNDSGLSASSVRVLLPASAITSGTTAFVLTLNGRTDANFTITKVSLVERDGATLDGVDASNKQLTFGGTWAAGGVVPQNGTLTSDAVTLALDGAKDYFLTFYCAGSVGTYFNGGSSTSAWVISGDHASDIDWAAKTPTSTWSHVYNALRIEETSEIITESAPSIDVVLTQSVTPGVDHNPDIDVNDQDEDIVEATVFCSGLNIGFTYIDLSGGATVAIKTS